MVMRVQIRGGDWLSSLWDVEGATERSGGRVRGGLYVHIGGVALCKRKRSLVFYVAMLCVFCVSLNELVMKVMKLFCVI